MGWGTINYQVVEDNRELLDALAEGLATRSVYYIPVPNERRGDTDKLRWELRRVLKAAELFADAPLNELASKVIVRLDVVAGTFVLAVTLRHGQTIAPPRPTPPLVELETEEDKALVAELVKQMQPTPRSSSAWAALDKYKKED